MIGRVDENPSVFGISETTHWHAPRLLESIAEQVVQGNLWASRQTSTQSSKSSSVN